MVQGEDDSPEKQVSVRDSEISTFIHSVDQKLAVLQNVPQQLSVMLESLMQIQAKLNETHSAPIQDYRLAGVAAADVLRRRHTRTYTSSSGGTSLAPLIGQSRYNPGAACGEVQASSTVSRLGQAHVAPVSTSHNPEQRHGALGETSSSIKEQRRPSDSNSLIGMSPRSEATEESVVTLPSPVSPAAGRRRDSNLSHHSHYSHGATISTIEELPSGSPYSVRSPTPGGDPGPSPSYADLLVLPSTISSQSRRSPERKPTSTSQSSNVNRLREDDNRSDGVGIESTSFTPSRASGARGIFSFSLPATKVTSMRDAALASKMFGEEQRIPPLMMMPNGAARLAVDCVVVVAVVICGFVIPFRLAYFDARDLVKGGLGTFLCVMDVLWLTDVLLRFRTAVLRHGSLVTSVKHLALMYAKTWLVPDVLATCPLALMPTNSVVIFTVGCLKLMKIPKVGPLLNNLEKETQWFKVTYLKLVILTALFCNIIACMWRGARRMDDGTNVAQSTGQAWILYIEDTYWVQMTMTTVGYGDIAPCGIWSRLMAVFGMLIAPLFFGAIVSVLTHATERLVNDPASRQAADAAHFMRKRSVPKDLQKRVVRNLKSQLYYDEHITTVRQLLAKLSPGVQRELSLELLRRVILKFPLFRNAPRCFVAEIAQAHTWVQAFPGDLIVEDGQVVEELVFVIHGRLVKIIGRAGEVADKVFTDAMDSSTEEEELCGGAWFGETCLFTTDAVRDFTVFAASESELAVLAASDYHRICVANPDMCAHHEFLLRAIADKNVELKDLSYKEASAHKPAGTSRRPSIISVS